MTRDKIIFLVVLVKVTSSTDAHPWESSSTFGQNCRTILFILRENMPISFYEEPLESTHLLFSMLMREMEINL